MKKAGRYRRWTHWQVWVPVLLAAAALLILLSAVYFYEPSGGNSIFPETIENLKLTNYFEGDAARRDVQSLHNMEMNVKSAYKAIYRGDSRVTIWMSESGSEAEASSLLEKMVAGIRSMNSRGMVLFSDPEERQISGIKTYYSVGDGEFHYYYTKGVRLFWIAISNPDPDYQRRIMESVIRDM
ncbi:MAG TPA: hypothetical protein HA257_07235 [Candidatus Methanoperedenaceae archaeon]|nr:hypothetical protein [Candidatus Methanoperedenaceae archaeon]